MFAFPLVASYAHRYYADARVINRLWQPLKKLVFEINFICF